MRRTFQAAACLFLCCVFLIPCLAACDRARKNFPQSGVAMGSVVAATVFGSNEKALRELDTLAVVRAADGRLSKNMAGSDISRINAAGGEPVAVSSQTYDAIKQTAEIYAVSDGRAAVTCGRLTELWGFDTDDFRLPTVQEIARELPLSDDGRLAFYEGNRVSAGRGQLLNLGSVGKGIACDEAVAFWKEHAEAISGGVISVGGSVAVYGRPPRGESWSVGIRDPFGGENDCFAILSLKDAFVSTSGDYEKSFTAQDGRAYHHILDLKTGYPVEGGLTSVTVVAETGLQSDALSTLCFILGKEEACKVLEFYNAEAVFVFRDKTVFATDGLKPFLSLTAEGFELL